MSLRGIPHSKVCFKKNAREGSNRGVRTEFSSAGDVVESSWYLAHGKRILFRSMDFRDDDASKFENVVKSRLGHYLNTVELHLYELVGYK